MRFEKGLLARINRQRRRDNWHNALYIAGDYGIIAGAIALAQLQPSVLTHLGAVLLIGSRMRAFDNLTHEASHGTLFRNRHLNRWTAMLLCAFPVGTSFHAYKNSHMLHHRYLGDPMLDPDRVRYRELGVERFPVSRRELAGHLVRVFLLTHVPRYLRGTLQSFVYLRGVPRGESVARYAYWTALLATFTVFGLWREFLLFWIVPFLTSFQILRYLSEISEHAGLYDGETDLDMIRNNLCHPLWTLIQYPHGDQYHLVHHLFPGIPHYRIERVHRILMDDEEYRQGHHCFGYFFPRVPGWRSTLTEMVRRDEPAGA